jgi:hypothetical protein
MLICLFVVVDNLSLLNGGTSQTASRKGQHQWIPSQPQQKTGGPNWQHQNLTVRSTVPASQPGWAATQPSVPPQQGLYRQPFGQPAGPPMPQPMGVRTSIASFHI